MNTNNESREQATVLSFNLYFYNPMFNEMGSDGETTVLTEML